MDLFGIFSRAGLPETNSLNIQPFVTCEYGGTGELSNDPGAQLFKSSFSVLLQLNGLLAHCSEAMHGHGVRMLSEGETVPTCGKRREKSRQ